MANNRMYLVNTRTGAQIFLAKYYPSTGWYCGNENLPEDLNRGFHAADFGHLTTEQHEKNAAVPGFGIPYPSAGGMYGAEWKLELESD